MPQVVEYCLKCVTANFKKTMTVIVASFSFDSAAFYFVLYFTLRNVFLDDEILTVNRILATVPYLHHKSLS